MQEINKHIGCRINVLQFDFSLQQLESSTYLDILGRESCSRGRWAACEGFSQSFTPPGSSIATFLWEVATPKLVQATSPGGV